MNVQQALQFRKSVRAYTSEAISVEQVTRILEVARCAPSGANVQPWQVAVVMGDMKQTLIQALQARYRRGDSAAMDFQYYPLDWSEPYRQRRIACGLQLYSALGIKRDDKQSRQAQWIRNYSAFDAPVMLFFFMDNKMQTGSFLDCGMFIQSVMLAAVSEGLATCPQAALAEFPDTVKSILGYEQNSVLVCGMALGYEDCEAAVNLYRTPRVPVNEFVRFYS